MNGAIELKLTALRTPISNGALSADQLPVRLKLANWGDNPSTKGNIRLTAVSAAALPQRQVELGFDRIALDFEHNTVPGTVEFERTHEPRPVAAYGIPRIVPGEGLFLDDIEWTPEGKKSALNFADLSPAVHQDEAGNVDFIHSAGLVRNGAIHGLSFFSVTLPQPSTSNPPQHRMAQTKLVALSALASILGLPEDSEEKDVFTKLKDRLTSPTELVARVHALESAAPRNLAALSAKINGKDVTFTAAEVIALTARVQKLEDTLTTNTATALAVERAKLVPLFAAEGRSPINPTTRKAYTAEELSALDLPTLMVLHANTPITVPLSARSRTGNTEIRGELKGLAKAIAAHKQASGQ